MCGIVGYFDIKDAGNLGHCECIVAAMANAMVRRGPDDCGVWVDNQVGVALGHRRLSIIDLSPQGHQPMLSSCGRYVIVLNGEVYNYQEIREDLEVCFGAHMWRGHSDTEVLIEAIRCWGVEETLRRMVGMFAFAVWDREERSLTLARDRMGEKPLYYGWSGDVFLFGSELKALRKHYKWNCQIDRDALALMMRHNCIPAPYSIYKGIKKLPPASFLKLDVRGLNCKGTEKIETYWSLREIAECAMGDQYRGSECEAQDELESLLRRSISQQMISDVPLGAFLSGGVDSSTVVALMQAQSSRPIKTFTIGLMEAGYDEARYASDVAKHLGTEHTELYVTPVEAMSIIPSLPSLYDEPFSDSSQIVTHLVAKLAKQHVTVSLSGDGGDELFGGYNRHILGKKLWRNVKWAPRFLRSVLASGIQALPTQYWDAMGVAVNTLRSSKVKYNRVGDKMHKFADVFVTESPEAMYKKLVSHWEEPSSLILGSSEPSTILTDRSKWTDISDLALRMMYLDAATYLPDDILVKVDRACMGVSLESRVPMLDHRIVEYAWKLPLSFKIRGGEGKWLLRQVLYRYVPKHLIERPKMGFSVPIFSWLRGSLREWAEELLHPDRLRREGYFDHNQVSQMWNEHKISTRNWQYHLWDVLMFQSWLEHNQK